MSDNLKAQAMSLKSGIEHLNAEAKKLEDTLGVIRHDRTTMAVELGTIERFLEAEGINLPYADKGGI